MDTNTIIIVVLLLVLACATLFLHVYLTDKYRNDMDEVARKVDSINWPISNIRK